MSIMEQAMQEQMEGSDENQKALYNELSLLRDERAKNGWTQKEDDRHEEICKLLKL